MAATPRSRSCKAAKAAGFTVVSRLRKDAALYSLPVPKPAGQRGPQATYGKERISLAKRAGQTARLAASRVRAVRREGDQDDQDVPGDMASGGRA